MSHLSVHKHPSQYGEPGGEKSDNRQAGLTLKQMPWKSGQQGCKAKGGPQDQEWKERIYFL